MQYGCPFHSSHEPTDHLDPLGGGYKCTTLTKKERKSSLKFFSLHGCCCLRKTSKYLINVFATSSLDERVLQSSQNCLSLRQFVSVYLVLFSCRTFLFPRGSVPSFATRRNDVKLSKPRTTLVYANNEWKFALDTLFLSHLFHPPLKHKLFLVNFQPCDFVS